jgi:hypothetical protein
MRIVVERLGDGDGVGEALGVGVGDGDAAGLGDGVGIGPGVGLLLRFCGSLGTARKSLTLLSVSVVLPSNPPGLRS